jgi:cell wall assembly regulator SMI1
MKKIRNSYSILGGKSEGRMPHGNNIKLDLRELRCEGGYWTEVAQDKAQLWYSLQPAASEEGLSSMKLVMALS